MFTIYYRIHGDSEYEILGVFISNDFSTWTLKYKAALKYQYPELCEIDVPYSDVKFYIDSYRYEMERLVNHYSNL